MSDFVEVGADALATEAGKKAVIKITNQPPFRFTKNWSPAEPRIVWMRRGNRKQAKRQMRRSRKETMRPQQLSF